MAELTAQQIEFAVEAFENVAGHAATGELLSMAERMRRAAPFLQLPWDDPTKKEAESFNKDYYTFASTTIPSTLHALVRFIRYRNAALQPKPVDLRRPYCCFIGCQNPPTWQVDAHVGLEDDTQSCDDHLGHLLTDAPLHTVCPIRPVDPLLEKIRSAPVYINLWAARKEVR